MTRRGIHMAIAGACFFVTSKKLFVCIIIGLSFNKYVLTMIVIIIIMFEKRSAYRMQTQKAFFSNHHTNRRDKNIPSKLLTILSGLRMPVAKEAQAWYSEFCWQCPLRTHLQNSGLREDHFMMFEKKEPDFMYFVTVPIRQKSLKV